MAVRDIGWITIAANGNHEMFIHGWAHNEAVTYSIVVFPGSGEGVPNPLAHATLTQGEYFQHVDGTFAQKIYIRNNALNNSCDVHVLAKVESL